MTQGLIPTYNAAVPAEAGVAQLFTLLERMEEHWLALSVVSWWEPQWRRAAEMRRLQDDFLALAMQIDLEEAQVCSGLLARHFKKLMSDRRTPSVDTRRAIGRNLASLRAILSSYA